MARFIRGDRLLTGLAAALGVLLVLMPSSSPLRAQQIDVWKRPVHQERSRSCDFLHYRVSLTFDLDRRAFWGENRITLTPFASGVNRLELDAEEILIETVLDEDGRQLPFIPSDTR